MDPFASKATLRSTTPQDGPSICRVEQRSRSAAADNRRTNRFATAPTAIAASLPKSPPGSCRLRLPSSPDLPCLATRDDTGHRMRLPRQPRCFCDILPSPLLVRLRGALRAASLADQRPRLREVARHASVFDAKARRTGRVTGSSRGVHTHRIGCAAFISSKGEHYA